jgi:DNA-binding transcriptional LysR family regulator
VVVLAHNLSYRKAAEELRLSQSALSRSVQSLERETGARLFDRDRGGVHLTTVGRAFIDRAATVLREADELDRMVRRHASGAQGKIAFGMAPMLAGTLVPEALSQGLLSSPDLRSHVVVRSVEALLPLLLREEIEFLVAPAGMLPEDAPVKAVTLGTFPISLLVRVGHPLLTSTGAVDGQLFPLVTSTFFAEHRLASYGVPFLTSPPQVVLEDHCSLIRIIERSDAVWLADPFAAADEIAAGRIRELPEALWRLRGSAREYRPVMYSLDRRSLSPAAQKLRDQFRMQIRRLIEARPSN